MLIFKINAGGTSFVLFYASPSKAKLVTLSKARFQSFSSAENLYPSCIADKPELTNTCLKVKSVAQSSRKEKLQMLKTYKN